MLVEALNWNPAVPRLDRDVLLGSPENLRYIDGWQRRGDVGVIAEDPPGRPVGAAWFRLFTAADPGYGFIADHIPEVSIAVRSHRRREGIGTALLDALEAEAVRRGVSTLSLSVEPANPARDLYQRRRYRQVGESGGSQIMRLDL
jgi:GNAT superfamily N-acetyltransferase